jgi:hypothetical protein
MEREKTQHATSGEPVAGWQRIKEHQHFVQFYEDDASLVESAAGFFGAGLRAGAACITIATGEHRMHLGARLRARGFEMDEAIRDGQYVSLDAESVLSALMVGGQPDSKLFDEIIEPVIAAAELRHPHVLAFGEMVALLSADGNHSAAVALEKLWNQLAVRHSFSLFCAYPRRTFSAKDRGMFEKVCAQHAAVIAA